MSEGPTIGGVWTKRLGNGLGGLAFVVVIGLSILHEGFNEWTRSMDQSIFGWTHSRYHPTLVTCAAIAGLGFGAIGFVAGLMIDKRGEQ